MNNDVKYLMRQMQLQKVIGELNALRITFYDPMGADPDYSDYKEKKKLIDDMINDLENNMG